ncbi:hypothetical protein [uncultured Pontibacter sp.]|uniref:hypothetical protein n=1 Tax=uncultured Pontibacter sp. TaxID=453356 RepID=UPI00261F11BB|nr:hypothetical protein [uncultured Pontibacter sp.]
MNRGKHKKLYYVPGLISLALLPLILSFIGADIVKRIDKRVIEINVYHPRNEAYYPLLKRNYKDFILSGNSANDNKSIESAKLLIKDLYAAEDTLNGVHFILQDSVSYGTFVELINSFKADSLRYFAIYGESIWVAYPLPVKQIESNYLFVCGTVGMFPVPDEPSFLDRISYYLPTASKLWPVLASLLFLILVSIKHLTSRNFEQPLST